jgi:glycosyltransferase involved in cell wall biosynthesis
MQASDMFLLPSQHAAPPLALLEAQASGLPVIAAHVEGDAAPIEHERTGLIYPLGDFKGLAGAVVNLVQQPGLAIQFGAAARAAAHSCPKPIDEAVAYLKVIEEVLSDV